MQRSNEPSIEITGAGIGKLGIESTTLNITLSVKNPLPMGITIKSAKFRIFLEKTEGETYLGEGMKENIRVEGDRTTTVDIPVTIKNSVAISAAGGLIGNDIEIAVRGTAAIDLKIAAPEIPFEKVLKIEGFLKG